MNKYVRCNAMLHEFTLLFHEMYVTGIFQRKVHSIIREESDFCNMILREILFLKQ